MQRFSDGTHKIQADNGRVQVKQNVRQRQAQVVEVVVKLLRDAAAGSARFRKV